jgi:hypothetical protein
LLCHCRFFETGRIVENSIDQAEAAVGLAVGYFIPDFGIAGPLFVRMLPHGSRNWWSRFLAAPDQPQEPGHAGMPFSR